MADGTEFVMTEIAVEHIRKSYVAVLRRQWYTYLTLVSYPAVLAFFWIGLHWSAVRLAWIGGFVTVLGLGSHWRGIRRTSQKRINLLFPVGATFQASADDAGLSQKSESGSGTQAWSRFERGWLGNEALILKHQSQALFTIVPRSTLTEDEVAIAKTKVQIDQL